eukprot:171894-Amphidinium_carterae.1
MAIRVLSLGSLNKSAPLFAALHIFTLLVILFIIAVLLLFLLGWVRGLVAVGGTSRLFKSSVQTRSMSFVNFA